MLSELIEYKAIYQEMTSARSLELLKQHIGSESSSSKANSFVLLSNLVQKYKSNEQF